MEYLKKTISLFLCLLMGITGPAISTALADGYGNNAASNTTITESGDGGPPCYYCVDCMDKKRASSSNRSYFYNGSEFLQETDLFLPGTMPIRIQHTYNNQATFDSPLGYGWDFTLNERLRTYADNSVVLRLLTGVKLHFLFTGGGYICEENPQLTLSQNPDGSFVFYESPAGGRSHFDINGRLIHKEDSNGNALHMTYSEDLKPLIGTSANSIIPSQPMIVSNNYQLQRIEQWDPAGTLIGQHVNFHYDNSNGRLISISDSTGRTVSFQHDSLGNLIRIDYPEGLSKIYQYTDVNDPHNMTNSLKGYDNNSPEMIVEREYDIDDRLIKETYAGGILDIDYTIPLEKTTVTKTIVNNQGLPLHQVDTVYQFDPQGFLLQTTNDQLSMEFIRDSRNNITEQILWENNGSATNPTLVKYLSAQLTYDDNSQLLQSAIDLDDGEQLITKFAYKDAVLIEKQIFNTANPENIRHAFLEYNYKENIPTTIARAKTLTGINPLPTYNAVSFSYDISGQPDVVSFENGDKIESNYINGLLVSHNGFFFTYDNRGNIISSTDRNNNVTQYEYDDIGRVTKIINALGDETLFSYLGWHLFQTEAGKRGNSPGKITNSTYDRYGRLVETSVNLSGSPVNQMSYTYDSENNLMSITDQIGNRTSYEFDPWNRPVKMISPEGLINSVSYSFNGQVTSTTDSGGNVTSYSYDKLGHVTQIIDPLGGTTSFQINAMGQVSNLTDSEGRIFSFDYDLLGRTIRQDSPVSGTKVFTYDKRGRLHSVQYENGTMKELTYNQFNMVEQVAVHTGTSDNTLQRFGYDNMGNMLWYSDSDSPDPLFTLTYDSLNRLKNKTLNPINKTMHITYNAHGQRQQLTIFDNNTELFHYSYSYDEADRLTTISESPTNKSTTFSYDTRGFINEKNYSNGISAFLLHTPNGRLADLHYKKSDNTTIDHYQYEYNNAGKISKITDLSGEALFTYDTFNRLSVVDYPVASPLSDESYTYDLTGNRQTSATIADWTYDSTGKLLGFSDHSLSYNEKGQQISENIGGQITTYEYDKLDRLLSITDSSTQTTYAYDFVNRRLKKTVNGNDTWFMYDGMRPVAEFDDTGQLNRYYNTIPGSHDLVGITETNNYYTSLTNHLQSPIYVTNSSQITIWNAKYQSFGETIIDDDADSNGTTFSQPFRFPGQYFDQETGWDYNWHRFYNTQTGRYNSADPTGLNGGINLYGYAGADPVNRIDPSGLKDLNSTRRRDAAMGTLKVIGGGIAIYVVATATAPIIAPAACGAAALSVLGGYVAIIIGGMEILIAGTAPDKNYSSDTKSISQAETLLDPVKQVAFLSSVSTGHTCQEALDHAVIVGMANNIHSLSGNGIEILTGQGRGIDVLSNLIATATDTEGTAEAIGHLIPMNCSSSQNFSFSPSRSTNNTQTNPNGVTFNVQRITLTPEFDYKNWVQREVLGDNLLNLDSLFKKNRIVIIQK